MVVGKEECLKGIVAGRNQVAGNLRVAAGSFLAEAGGMMLVEQKALVAAKQPVALVLRAAGLLAV